MEQELDNLIGMLQDELASLRHRADPNDASRHKQTRMFLTLALAIQELQQPKEVNNG